MLNSLINIKREHLKYLPIGVFLLIIGLYFISPVYSTIVLLVMVGYSCTRLLEIYFTSISEA